MGNERDVSSFSGGQELTGQASSLTYTCRQYLTNRTPSHPFAWPAKRMDDNGHSGESSVSRLIFEHLNLNR